MEIAQTQGLAQSHVTATQQPAPPPAQADGRASADAAAVKIDPRPEVPLPMPPTQTQTALVGKAALSDKDASPKPDTAGTSDVQRMLKPYGISMLPEK
jgi:hypothetical protein|tara:strand:- start:186 stop:479 length:294 start_codon:yes stop_codon:yes gene_type:complete